MPAHKLHVTVPKNRRAIVDFPDAVPPGEVELIILVPAAGTEADESQELTDEGFPVFAVPSDAKPITPEMVQRALEES